MTRRSYSGPDLTQPEGRSGLSKRLAENALDNMGSVSNTETRKPSEVVGRIVERDEGGVYVRKASLEDLKRASGETAA